MSVFLIVNLKDSFPSAYHDWLVWELKLYTCSNFQDVCLSPSIPYASNIKINILYYNTNTKLIKGYHLVCVSLKNNS